MDNYFVDTNQNRRTADRRDLATRKPYAWQKERRVSPAVTEFIANQEVKRLRALNTELIAALQAVATLNEGQGMLNLAEVAGQARTALAKVQP